MNQPSTSRRKDNSFKSNSSIRLAEINSINERIFPERLPLPALPGGLHPWGDELRRRTAGRRRSNPSRPALIGALISGGISLTWCWCHGEFSTDGVMAQGRRVERVAALIRKEVSELMINGIRDERVHQGMVSIMSEVSGDPQHCKIFERVREAQNATRCSRGRPPAASGENWGDGCR